MSETVKQKLKLLYLYKIFCEQTDEDNGITINDIVQYLASNGIKSERKTIYTDIKQLQLFGLDIITKKTTTVTYHLASRDFELGEIKTLCSLVASSKFITESKSKDLIKKLGSLTTHKNAVSLQRNVIVADRCKTDNESVYSVMEIVDEAVRQKKQVSFNYLSYGLDKNLYTKRDGERYTASPYLIVCDNEYHYMVAYYKRYGRIVNFRLDKIKNVKIENVLITVSPNADFNPARYKRKLFTMYGGTPEKVRLRIDNSLIGVALDRFGKDIKLLPYDSNSFCIDVDIEVSDAFFGWLFKFGKQICVLSPESVNTAFQDKLKALICD